MCIHLFQDLDWFCVRILMCAVEAICVPFVFLSLSFSSFSYALWCSMHMNFHVGVNVILDFVGASYWENHTQCVAVDGRIVLLGLVTTLVTYSCYRIFLKFQF